ncbi:hypothetical protein PFICI_04752 [Pestalotiopsis fici W106-1]|uniref:Uncharacterized protein n=1 Tax=Pestalotiopsis fici (strain W106-1 / CGMCC3.15140) TaxID=1229662 RepID=W3XCH3_PESFW|nr:uncharacterized protein PFICI_04752 [Pestalotiopsis fici W106-1]ETS82876.1 hypothetical protein PFICI_04752 [Pestalotiopsis fici W106-1]
MADVKLDKEPTRHPDCCLSLSSTLLDVLTSIVSHCAARTNADQLVLSIGSGSGLLEALLLERWAGGATNGVSHLFIEGVEVQKPGGDTPSLLNKYLPEQHHSAVKGTWDLSPRAADAVVLIFVYPRSPALLRRYLEEATCEEALGRNRFQLAIWLGPKCDWTEFEGCFAGFSGWNLRVIPDEESGLFGYEMLAVLERQIVAVAGREP